MQAASSQMSLRTLATVLGVSHAFLSQIRTGKRPLPETLKAKIKALGAYHMLTAGKQAIGAVRMERETGLEPATFCLGSRRSTN